MICLAESTRNLFRAITCLRCLPYLRARNKKLGVVRVSIFHVCPMHYCNSRVRLMCEESIRLRCACLIPFPMSLVKHVRNFLENSSGRNVCPRACRWGSAWKAHPSFRGWSRSRVHYGARGGKGPRSTCIPRDNILRDGSFVAWELVKSHVLGIAGWMDSWGTTPEQDASSPSHCVKSGVCSNVPRDTDY